MPKQIDNLNENILAAGRKLLVEEGYKGVNVRKVANMCSIAVGTMYNYYTSKDWLIASIMQEDWEKLTCSAGSNLNEVDNLLDGLHILFDAVKTFSNLYRSTWSEYNNIAKILTKQRHVELVSQLESLMIPLFVKFGKDCHDDGVHIPLSEFLVETTLAGATRPDISFESLRPIYETLIG